MPVLKRKIIRNIDEIIIKDEHETKETVSLIPTQSYLICNKCGKVLALRDEQHTTIECSQCGCPEFHTSVEFTAQCVNCTNKIEVKNSFYGYCEKCRNKIWEII